MSAFPIFPLLEVHSSPLVTPDPLEPDLEEEKKKKNQPSALMILFTELFPILSQA